MRNGVVLYVQAGTVIWQTHTHMHTHTTRIQTHVRKANALLFRSIPIGRLSSPVKANEGKKKKLSPRSGFRRRRSRAKKPFYDRLYVFLRVFSAF